MHPDSTYKSIPLSQFISDNEVTVININNLGRVIHLTMKNGSVEEFSYGLKIDKIDHVGFLIGHKDHIYYIILNGQSNKNWIWRYTDKISIDDLF